MCELFVCEKPSVARDLANIISGGYTEKDGHYEGKDGKLYTYAFGHLVRCVDPSTIDEDWGWKGNVHKLPFFTKNIPLTLIDETSVKKQYKNIKTLMGNSDLIYIATDPGREGEHIFRKIYSLSGVQKPLKRIWIKNNTEEGVLKAFRNAKDSTHYEGLAMAGKLREESDLLIGLNATMMATKLSNSSNVLSLGRVQTPTLAMIVNRDKVIEGFSKVVHYSIVATDQNGMKYELVLDKNSQLTKEQAEGIMHSLGSRSDFNISTKERKEKPEKLFDLTELQKYMNKTYKWSAEYTLKITQSLYEKRYVTYPRTSSQYIASDSELPALLEKHADHEWVGTIISNAYKIEPSYIDISKVTDHEAIIITTKVAKGLSGDEELLYKVIFTRFLAAFYPYAIKEETMATFSDHEYEFKAKETSLINPGWRELYGEEIEEGKLKNSTLDGVGEYKVIQKETQPPKRYSEATLLNDMKLAAKFLDEAEEKEMIKSVEGIGTSATRATIIEKLVQRGFVEKKKNQLISTELGRELIEMMPKDFSLYSVKLTAFFESMLSQVEHGQLDEATFYEELEGLVNRIAKEIKGNVKQLTSTANYKKEVITHCPKCKKEVYENQKAYSCSGYKEGCKTTVWKNGLEKLGKKKITKNEATKLLEGKVIKVSLKSKQGKAYKADVIFNLEKNWIEFANKK
ncbi:DNA topoisomerase [Pontibacillus litoralis]|uniref:DNA topoisomerase n=1 Tax=Pontibacillus litoralis JSM 072002 TaxID=1385512 RepID=A0A0A5G261_9BACI|nr:DNA topoisomerase [Pontibacillus litoralis]KGX85170.1 DNA topoisomerase III [Pontibacillus litoralis JSM 072002]